MRKGQKRGSDSDRRQYAFVFVRRPRLVMSAGYVVPERSWFRVVLVALAISICVQVLWPLVQQYAVPQSAICRLQFIPEFVKHGYCWPYLSQKRALSVRLTFFLEYTKTLFTVLTLPHCLRSVPVYFRSVGCTNFFHDILKY
ncbi:unnamed protein product [Gongylonema pulchrum]|uniref:G_PROTEIN_RECEP_F1_2 domain-containing protein n=1 Tax=Gongylonema pulchrum TaxID=637853 RepID=A0A183DNY5_9BILA|nr:unnamed protein product [Gongylonema pulchrum]